MTSWRAAASRETQDDLDGLVNVCLEFAEQQLRAHGEFFPFAAGVRSAGRIEMIMAEPSALGDRPSSADVLAACRGGVADRGKDLRAAAVVMDVSTPAGGDGGVRVELQHAQGTAITVVLQYAREGDHVQFGQLRATSGGRAGLRVS